MNTNTNTSSVHTEKRIKCLFIESLYLHRMYFRNSIEATEHVTQHKLTGTIYDYDSESDLTYAVFIVDGHVTPRYPVEHFSLDGYVDGYHIFDI